MGNAPFWGRFWEIPQLTDAERQRILDIRSAIHRILSDYGKHQGTYSMIHADLHPGNLLVNGNQLAIIDFDDAGFGWHQYELVAALFYYWNKPDFNTVHDALIAGYRTERTFDDTAIELLPMFLVIRALALLGWIHDRPELDNSHRLPGLIAIACDLADDLGL
jgi:Ser/Thr protein kinase RdoA (MazF antagonist)